MAWERLQLASCWGEFAACLPDSPRNGSAERLAPCEEVVCLCAVTFLDRKMRWDCKIELEWVTQKLIMQPVVKSGPYAGSLWHLIFRNPLP